MNNKAAEEVLAAIEKDSLLWHMKKK
jgi:hypothetical protein